MDSIADSGTGGDAPTPITGASTDREDEDAGMGLLADGRRRREPQTITRPVPVLIRPAQAATSGTLTRPWRGGRAKGKKLLVGIAVERLQPRGLGRCRMAVLPDATPGTLGAFLADHVEEGSTVITDAGRPTATPSPGATSANAGPPPGERRTRHRRASTGSPPWPRLTAGHPPRLRRRRPPPQLPRRVRLPVQPPALAQPRTGLLSGPRVRRRPRARALPRPRAQSPTNSRPTTTPRNPWQPADLERPSAKRPWR